LRKLTNSLEMGVGNKHLAKGLGTRPGGVLRCVLALSFLPLGGFAGCSRFQPKPAVQYVYVTAKDTYLRDRVAAVSNRVGQVQNGEKLKVLDHGRHWLKVLTGTGTVGWIQEREVATQAVGEAFEKLAVEHRNDPQVASGVTRDVVYLHLEPGRDTEHFYLLPESDKLKVLRRATLVKSGTAALTARAQRAIPQVPGTKAALKPEPGSAAGKAEETKVDDAPPPVYEDWWLVRDTAGHTGWLYGRMMDVDAPDTLTRYAEGQRIVGAYVLSTVYDAEAPFPDKNVPIYVTVLGPYSSGLPYDFDQVRVFTWSVVKHRYETAFRDRNIEGYLPVSLMKLKDPYSKAANAQQEMPGFSYKVLPADAPAVKPDPATGAMVPSRTITKTYRLEGNYVHRIAAPGSKLEEEAHPVAEKKKEKSKRRRR
jgi:SH3-like domain-containing protein